MRSGTNALKGGIWLAARFKLPSSSTLATAWTRRRNASVVPSGEAIGDSALSAPGLRARSAALIDGSGGQLQDRDNGHRRARSRLAGASTFTHNGVAQAIGQPVAKQAVAILQRETHVAEPLQREVAQAAAHRVAHNERAHQ